MKKVIGLFLDVFFDAVCLVGFVFFVVFLIGVVALALWFGSVVPWPLLALVSNFWWVLSSKILGERDRNETEIAIIGFIEWSVVGIIRFLVIVALAGKLVF